MFLLAAFFIFLQSQLNPALSLTNITTFYYPSFLPNTTPDIIYSGNATATSQGVIDLSFNQSSGRTCVGRVNYAKPVRLYDPVTGSVADFVSHFTFFIDRGANYDSIFVGEGITFFLSRVDSILPLNSESKWLGLFNESLDGLATNQIVAVEFDTWSNAEDPPGENHMGIDVNSVISNVTVDWRWDLTNRTLNGEAWVWYNSTTQILFARMTNRNLKPYTEWSISLPINLTKVLPELIVVGFTGSATSSYELHQILSWNFTSTITTPDPPPPTNRTTPDPPPPTNRGNYKLVLILVPCFVVLFLIVLIVATTITLIRRTRTTNNRRKDKGDEQEVRKDGDVHTTADLETVPSSIMMDGHGKRNLANERNEQNVRREEDHVNIFTTNLDVAGPRRFIYKELLAATNCFSPEERLGKGGSGWVYRGILSETHKVVAVKRLFTDSSQRKKQYISEVTAISQLHHPNLVRLIGWCHEGCERLLVYEYMDGGSLDSYLFAPQTEKVLPWAQRMRTALDVASAVLYLHEEWVQCVVHRDIKASNVLIDSDFHARLGDFGLARLVDHEKAAETTMVAGTMGYIAPECIFKGQVSKESDVYSFGVLLLEIACGRRASQPVSKRETLLMEWVWGLYGLDALPEAVDRRLGSEFSREEAECMMMVGLWCALPDPATRPTIRDAIRTLRFQSELPNLPQQMPRVIFQMPTVIDSSSY